LKAKASSLSLWLRDKDPSHPRFAHKQDQYNETKRLLELSQKLDKRFSQMLNQEQQAVINSNTNETNKNNSYSTAG